MCVFCFLLACVLVFANMLAGRYVRACACVCVCTSVCACVLRQTLSPIFFLPLFLARSLSPLSLSPFLPPHSLAPHA